MRSNPTRAGFALALTCVLLPATSFAQYNESAGRSAPRASTTRIDRLEDGSEVRRTVMVAPAADVHGNARGSGYDLAIDGAFDGQTIAVLHLYTGEGFDFSLPREALRQKGFSVYRWSNGAPSPADLRAGLARACQLWVISDRVAHLNEAHLRVIEDFFNAGHGVYIWGDNEPYYADANAVAQRLLGTTMSGNIPGDQVVGLQHNGRGAGVLQDHLLTTGLENLYEGITIATVRPTPSLQPIVYGSAGNLVAAFYDRQGRRAILDGGFTRLFLRWDTAGTARYVKNSAAWLTNAERFGTAVLAPGMRLGAGPAGAPTLVPDTTPAREIAAPPTPRRLAPRPRASAPNRGVERNGAEGDGRRSSGLWAMVLGAAALVLSRKRG